MYRPTNLELKALSSCNKTTVLHELHYRTSDYPDIWIRDYTLMSFESLEERIKFFSEQDKNLILPKYLEFRIIKKEITVECSVIKTIKPKKYKLVEINED